MSFAVLFKRPRASRGEDNRGLMKRRRERRGRFGAALAGLLCPAALACDDESRTRARGVEFYNRKEIKDVLAYLRVIANPNDAVSLERVVNVPPRGIGDSSVKQIRCDHSSYRSSSPPEASSTPSQPVGLLASSTMVSNTQ